MVEYFCRAQGRSTSSSELASLAGRIATQLDKHQTSAPAVSACFDDLLGTVYSLFYASRHEYTDPAGKSLTGPDIANVSVRAKDMAHGTVREDGKWTAGFYFNNALFRLAAVYHRILKVLTQKEATSLYVRDLLPTALQDFKAVTGRNWNNRNIQKIHSQVNELKHTAQGVYGGRDVLFKEATDGVEELLVLIETLG